MPGSRATVLAARRRLWLFAGTGEGPPLAAALQRQGWCLRVSVVSPEAGQAYGELPHLELFSGALAGPQALELALRQAQQQGDPFALVLDATHPFATTIKATLAAGCRAARLPLLRLQRPWCDQQEGDGPGADAAGPALLAGLAALEHEPLAGTRLLLALGARQLPAAVSRSPGARHHARLLPTAFGLQQAMAAGLPAERVACLRPTRSGQVETALLRRWGIEVILARQSGGEPEQRWRRIAHSQGCRLLLLRRPPEEPGRTVLGQEALLAHLAAWPGATG
ncbi:precorrin-6A/cobalt-precorrin-6A reductase [Cyanobium sp. LEGE 06143]|uniref:precorrin-6A/cobalt-precorrin-6A reductase n=1 Tax=Cyanobium sp. LEGE 06143 TaxID=945727 RepID=UPI001882FC7D|nr:precorrin-6A/cobalt-precorrin-6A reductase [Cyanobium sp. LEGE 06143]MBE9173679.1 precorrin-6A/cobalt-precorrin-6A reductase [Cyanobium sp. LEGE 06143]